MKPVIPPVVNDPKRLARALFRKPSGKPKPIKAKEKAGEPVVK